MEEIYEPRLIPHSLYKWENLYLRGVMRLVPKQKRKLSPSPSALHRRFLQLVPEPVQLRHHLQTGFVLTFLGREYRNQLGTCR